MSPVTVQRIEHPSDELVNASAALFADLMKDNLAAVCLSGGKVSLLSVQARAILLAGIQNGEYYTATNENGELVGYTLWMPPGQELFSTEEQKVGLHDFMARLPEIGKEYQKTIYQSEFPDVLDKTLGPEAKVNYWWLHLAMVRRDYQRKGISRALLAPVRTKATQAGETLAVCTTSDENVHVYIGLGFDLKGSRMMPSPWDEWPVHSFLMDTRAA